MTEEKTLTVRKADRRMSYQEFVKKKKNLISDIDWLCVGKPNQYYVASYQNKVMKIEKAVDRRSYST